MLIVGEKINTSRKRIAEAVEKRDASFIGKVAQEMIEGGALVIGEELVRSWGDEAERRDAVLELHSCLLRHLISQRTPADVVGTAVGVLHADLVLEEYKLDRARLLALTEPWFSIKKEWCIWPADEDVEFGDFVFVCRRRA